MLPPSTHTPHPSHQCAAAVAFLPPLTPQLLSYALVLSDNHIYTSGATGTHAAAIRGALRAENPELLTVILPQTLKRQPREIRELIAQVRRGESSALRRGALQHAALHAACARPRAYGGARRL